MNYLVKMRMKSLLFGTTLERSCKWLSMNTEENMSKDNIKSPQNNDHESEASLDETAASLEQVAESYPEVEPVLEKLNPDDKSIVERVLWAEMFSGPLPHPSHLREYAEVHSEAPDIIFNMAQKQQEHKHHMQKTHINKSFGMEKLGIILGFILAFVFLVGGFILIAIDKEVIGVATVK